MRGLSLVAASGGHSSSRCTGPSLSRPLLLWSTGSRRAGSVVVAHGPSCPAACGIFPDQGSNPCPLHWQADSQPLCHQGSPLYWLFSISGPPAKKLSPTLHSPQKFHSLGLYLRGGKPSEAGGHHTTSSLRSVMETLAGFLLLWDTPASILSQSGS